MNVRHPRGKRKHPEGHYRLKGWKLVIALLVLSGVAIATLLITGSPLAVSIVLVPLLLLLGVTVTMD